MPSPGAVAFVRRLFAVVVVAALGLAAPARVEAGQTTIEVVGDSQAQGLAGALERLFLRNPQFRVLDRSKISTGIIVRSGYDWPQVARTLAAAHNADVVVMMFGANDRPPIRRGVSVDPTLSAEFRQNYAQRVHEVIAAFRDAGMPVIWVGHPVVRDNVFTEDMQLLNAIYHAAATDEGARWLPTWDMFTTPDGGFTPYGKGIDGMTQRLRADDGVHFTSAGYDVVATRLEPLIEAQRAKLASGQ
ncbi:MAG TPA: DUF459 domain-containing protein [Stellaceae bacterium]|jgi:hypothetical protein|nr:DUF459 domain-containing protein [Stellaceae bacterium]